MRNYSLLEKQIRDDNQKQDPSIPKLYVGSLADNPNDIRKLINNGWILIPFNKKYS